MGWRLFNVGYKSYIAKRKPSHCSSRLCFAEKCSDWHFSNWKNVIFSDESHFEVFNRKNPPYVCRLPSESDKPYCFRRRGQGGGGSVNVWGSTSSKGVGPFVFYDNRMNGRNYIDAVKHELVPYIKINFDRSEPWYYVQEDAPCHKSEFSIKLSKENKVNVLDWPAASPGLYVLENLLNIIC